MAMFSPSPREKFSLAKGSIHGTGPARANQDARLSNLIDEGQPEGADLRHWLQAADELAGEDTHEPSRN